MDEKRLSVGELMALFWGGILAPAVELLPGYSARLGGAGVWMVAAAGGLAAGAGWAFSVLAGEEGTVADGILNRTGGILGKGVLLLYIMWGIVLVTVRLRAGAQRLLFGGERDGAAWFFVFVLGGVSLWLARRGLQVLGRGGQVLFRSMVLTGAVVLLLGMGQVRGENLLPELDRSVETALGSIWPGVSVLGYGLFIPFLYRTGTNKSEMRRWLVGLGWGCALLAGAQTVILGCFGPRLTLSLGSPFLQLAKSVGLEGGFQRVESVVAGIWVFSDLLLMGCILWVVGDLSRRVIPKMPRRGMITLAAVGSMAAALAVFGERVALSAVTERWIPGGNVILGVILPCVLVILTRGSYVSTK